LTGAGVVSFNGRFGTVNPAEGDYTLTQLGDVIITSASNAQLLQYNGSNWVNWTPNYLTSYTETDTLDSVTGRGNTTANSITVGSVTAAGLSNLLGQIRTFASTGNTYIGANPTSASDAGYKLDLNGTARISGDMTMWDDGTNNGNSRALIFRALGSTGNAQTGQILLDGFGAAGQDQLQLSASSIRLAPSTGSVTITGTTPNISTVAASGFRLNANSTTNGFTFTQAYNQISGDLLAVFTNSNQKKFSIAASDSSVTIASLSGTGSRMVVADANGVLSTQAIADLSGYVTLSTTQTITGAKTFSNITTFNQNIVGGIIKLSQGVLLSKSAAVGTDAGFLSLIATSATGLNYINIADGDAPSNTQRFAVPNTGTYTYTLPAASGTLALTSDIPSVAGVYLPLSGGTLTGALNGTSATFSGAVNGQSLVIKNSGVPAAQFYRDLDVTVVGSAGQGIEFGARSGSTYIAGAAIYGGLDNPATTGNLVFQTLTAGSLTTKLTINSAGGATFSAGATFGSDVFTYNNGGIFFSGGGSYTSGIFQSASGLNLQAGGSPKITISSAGNVGVNTTTPASFGSQRFLVVGNGAASQVARFTDGSNADLVFDNPTPGVSRITAQYGGAGTLAFASGIGFSETMRLTWNGLLGLGVSPSAWNLGSPVMQIGTGGVHLFGAGTQAQLGSNNYYNGTNYIYTTSNFATRYLQNSTGGEHAWESAASGTAGNVVSYSRLMTLFASGNLGLGTTNPGGKLHVLNSSVGGSYYGQLVVEENGEAAINIKGLNYSSIYFGDAANHLEGGIVYSHISNTLEFRRSGNVTAFSISPTSVATFTGDVKVKTLEVTNVGTNSTSSGVSTYMQITVNGQNYLIPLHGTP
jgi:hypothetical protein